MNKQSKIFVAGAGGMVGRSLCNRLKSLGYDNLVTPSSKILDLRRQADVESFFDCEKPDYVFLLAAHVGGIAANMTYPAEFMYDNILIQTNVIHSAHLFAVKKLLFVGSSCIYPTACPQPIKESYLLTGIPEPTNEGYALAKITGVKMCQYYNKQYGDNFISIFPPNLYGEYDNFHDYNSHVVSALIKRMHFAKQDKSPTVTVWGTGKPRREFLYVDDLTEAAVFLMENYNDSGYINVGSGIDYSIMELAKFIKQVVGFEGEIIFDSNMPDGMLRKVMDVTRINSLGWYAKTSLEDGLARTYQWFLKEIESCI